MIFLNPKFLFVMIIPLLILAFLIITNKKNISHIFDEKLLEKLTIKRNYLGATGRNILLFFIIFLFIISLARPVLPKGEISLKTTPYNFTILLDISNSMLCDDIYPNRLEFAKKKIDELLAKNQNINVAIYAFSDNLFLISPKTTDSEVLRYLISNFKPSDTFQNSSNLTDAIKNIKDKNIVVFSDLDINEFDSYGKNITFFKTATDSGGAIKKNGSYINDKYGNIVISKPNPTFAYKTKLENLLPKRDNSQTFTIDDYTDLYQYPLYLALFLLVVIFISFPKLKLFALLALFVFEPVKSQAFLLDFLHIKKANSYYKNKEFKKAEYEFKKVVKVKNSPTSHYNLANCYYKNKEYKKAIKEYNKVISKDKTLRYKTFFNLANSYFKTKLYKKSYEFYKIALSIKDTKKVRYNLLEIKKYISKKDLMSFEKSINPKQKNSFLKKIKQKSFMLKITNNKRQKSVSW